MKSEALSLSGPEGALVWVRSLKKSKDGEKERWNSSEDE
jgi:hypothetical protein